MTLTCSLGKLTCSLGKLTCSEGKLCSLPPNPLDLLLTMATFSVTRVENSFHGKLESVRYNARLTTKVAIWTH